jgi:hypothetical protein
LRSPPFQFEILHGRRRRNRVERHIDHGTDPSRRGGLGTGGEPFPVGSARLVEVDVSADEAATAGFGAFITKQLTAWDALDKTRKDEFVSDVIPPNGPPDR